MKPCVIRLQTRCWHKPGTMQLVGVSESVSGDFRLATGDGDFHAAVSWLIDNGYRFLRRDGGKRSGDVVVETFGLVSEFGEPLDRRHLDMDKIKSVSGAYEDEYLGGA